MDVTLLAEVGRSITANIHPLRQLYKGYAGHLINPKAAAVDPAAIRDMEDALLALLQSSPYTEFYNLPSVRKTLENQDYTKESIDHKQSALQQLLTGISFFSQCHAQYEAKRTATPVNEDRQFQIGVRAESRLSSLTSVSLTLAEWDKILETFSEVYPVEGSTHESVEYHGGSLIISLLVAPELWEPLATVAAAIGTLLIGYFFNRSPLDDALKNAQIQETRARTKLHEAQEREQSANADLKIKAEKRRLEADLEMQELFIRNVTRAILEFDESMLARQKLELDQIVDEMLASKKESDIRDGSVLNEAKGHLKAKCHEMLKFVREGNSIDYVLPSGEKSEHQQLLATGRTNLLGLQQISVGIHPAALPPPKKDAPERSVVST
jgi:hypothetical protein